MIPPSIADERYGGPRIRSLDSMEGLPAADAPHWTRSLLLLYPGLTLAAVIALAAGWLAQYGVPALISAFLFGAAFKLCLGDALCRDGIAFTARWLLAIGVLLLGAQFALAAWHPGERHLQVALFLLPNIAIGCLVTAAGAWGVRARFDRKAGLALRVPVRRPGLASARIACGGQDKVGE